MLDGLDEDEAEGLGLLVTVCDEVPDRETLPEALGDEESEELLEGEVEEVGLFVNVREELDEEDELAETELEGLIDGVLEEDPVDVALTLADNEGDRLAVAELVAEGVIDWLAVQELEGLEVALLLAD